MTTRNWFSKLGLVAAILAGGMVAHFDLVQPVFAEKTATEKPNNIAPEGFTSLFNGKDMTHWRGRKQNFSPYKEAEFTPDEKTKNQKEWNDDRDKHWRVDVEKGELVSDGHGVHLATEKQYGDFEFRVDYVMVSPNADSGVYLRSFPQIQIWDPENPKEVKNGAPKGSGALWNNNADNPGKWPLVKADNPVGSWNTLHVKMVGNKVWVWLNEKQTVDGQVLDNYFDRKKEILPTGAIELQTHGSEIRFRNIFVRDIKAADKK